MKSYRDLEIYQKAFDLAIKVHKFSWELPAYEKFEIGSQIRISAMSIKDNIVEGYGRRKYKAEFIRFLIVSHASCDELISQLETIQFLYPKLLQIEDLLTDYYKLSKQLNSFISYVQTNWKT
jgi:four helix bundle protein